MTIIPHIKIPSAGRWQKGLIHWSSWKRSRPKRRGFLLCQRTASPFYHHMCIPALASAMIVKLLQAASVSFQSCKNALTLRHIMSSTYGLQSCHKHACHRPFLSTYCVWQRLRSCLGHFPTYWAMLHTVQVKSLTSAEQFLGWLIINNPCNYAIVLSCNFWKNSWREFRLARVCSY